MSHEMDSKIVDKNPQMLASPSAAAGFRIPWRSHWFLIEIHIFFPVNANITPIAAVIRSGKC
jgi:hypothetical protein